MTGSQAHYRAFELTWCSLDLAIPELPTCSEAALAGGGPRIAIEPEEPECWPQLDPGPHDTPFLQMARGDLRLTVEGIGRFRITDGERIGWQRADAAVSNQAFRPRFVRGLGQEGANFMALARLQQRVPLAALPLPAGIGAMQRWLADQDLLTAAAQAETGEEEPALEPAAS